MKWTWIILIAFSCGTASSSEAQQITRIDNDELVQMMKNEEVQLVDVRTPQEVALGTIEGATAIDYYNPKFQEEFEQLDKTKPVIVYCASGRRSASASTKLAKMGFTEIYDLKDGYKGWKGSGYPIKN